MSKAGHISNTRPATFYNFFLLLNNAAVLATGRVQKLFLKKSKICILGGLKGKEFGPEFYKLMLPTPSMLGTCPASLQPRADVQPNIWKCSMTNAHMQLLTPPDLALFLCS